MKKRLPEWTCLVLGRALFCLPVVDDYVPTDLKDKVLVDWAHVHGGSEVDTPAPLSTTRSKKAIRYNRWQQLCRAIMELFSLIQLAIYRAKVVGELDINRGQM